MKTPRVVIAGGGAAGFFAAIACARAQPGAEVMILEKGPRFLAKVLVSGGGRCNVTHACLNERELAAHYPRGGQALLSAFHTFQPRDTEAWFAERGVKLKTESDGRMFPVTDSSQTIVDCFLNEARTAGVQAIASRGIERVNARPEGGFELKLTNAEKLGCDRLLLATGGCRAAETGPLATTLGHTLVPPVPSLFAFDIETHWVRELAGVAVTAEVSVPDTKLRERGALLLTHRGMSGPAILRLSAWGARLLQERNHQFTLRVNWLPELNDETITAGLAVLRQGNPARRVVNCPLAPLPGRLWEQLALTAGVGRETQWSGLTNAMRHALVQQLSRTLLSVQGKSMNKDEFVTCGGVSLKEVNFKTMESRLRPGLFFAGELLDIDGVTGGFNFQAAWTTGWIAGRAMAGH
jgi:predicted Rossmann fold flavoprotein